MGIFSDHAQKYWEYGLSVIPVNGKRPFTDGFDEWSFKAQTQEEIEQLIKEHGHCNIGLIMGPYSKVCAFDLDADPDRESVAPGLIAIGNAVKDMILPSPCEKVGAKGGTRFYKHNGLPNLSKSYMGQQVFDFISERKMTVIPPSIHPKTKQPFTWVNGINIIDVLDDLPEFPKDVLYKIANFIDSVDKKGDGVNKKSGRNDVLKSYVCAIMEKHDTDEVVRRVIVRDKAFHPANPLFSDKEEFRSDDENANAFNFVTSIKKTVYKEKGRRGEKTKSLLKPNKYPSLDNGFFAPDSNGSMKPNYKEFASYAKNEMHFIYGDGRAHYLYNAGKYDLISEDNFMNVISKLSPGASFGQVTNFRKEAEVFCYKDVSKISAPRGFINLANGVLNVKTKSLLPHNPDVFFRYKLPHNFDPLAECSKTKEFLFSSVGNDSNLVNLIFEMFGYTIEGSGQDFEKMFYLVGPARSGKGTCLKLLTSLVGDENISSTELNKLVEDYHCHTIDGKLLNVTGEFNNKGINVSRLKSILSYELVSMADKHKPVRSARLFAKFVCSGNGLPIVDSGGNMDSILRRFIFIPFENVVNESEININLAKELISEMPGIINESLCALDRLRLNNSFSTATRSKELADDFMTANDSVSDFFEENIQLTDNEFDAEKGSTLFIGYTTFCKESNRHPVGLKEFYSRAKIYMNAKRISIFKNAIKFDMTRKDDKALFFNGVKFSRYLERLAASRTNMTNYYAQKE